MVAVNASLSLVALKKNYAHVRQCGHPQRRAEKECEGAVGEDTTVFDDGEQVIDAYAADEVVVVNGYAHDYEGFVIQHHDGIPKAVTGLKVFVVEINRSNPAIAAAVNIFSLRRQLS
jgi:hypothetical protein